MAESEAQQSEIQLPGDVCARYAKLYTPLVSDTIERLGTPSPALDTRIQCLTPDPHVKLVGFAYPCQVRATDQRVEIDNLLRMMDSIPAGSVIVVSIDRENGCALWGGLMSAGAKRRGAVGAVVTGPVRDIAQIADAGFTVFAHGRSMLDIRGRGEMVDFGCTVQCGAVTVRSGDLIFGDANGVLCIPRERVMELLEICESAFAEEHETQTGLEAGQGAQAVYAAYGRF